MQTVVNTPTTQRLSVREIIGSDLATNRPNGIKVYARLSEAFAQPGVNVVLDFSNIRRIISAFLNAAVGKLCEHYSSEEINRRLSFQGFSEDDQELVALVIERAFEFYADREGFIQNERNMLEK